MALSLIRPIRAPFLHKIFKSQGHVSFLCHWEGGKKFRIKATIKLYHSATTMARNAIIMGKHIKEDGVCGDPFLEATDIGSRKAKLEVLTEWIMDRTGL